MSAGDPITGLCIVDKKSNCPAQYFVLERTSEGEEADLWKDGFFKKTTRYICYTKSVTASQWNHVLTNLVLIGAKDAVPQGYNAIRETLDTKEQALRKHTLCYQLLPKTTTSSAICDIQLVRTDRYKSEQLTFVGDLNGFNLVYKLSPIAQQRKVSPPSRTAPPPPAVVREVTPLSAPPPAQQANVPATNAISGIEFKLHERYASSTGDSTNQDELGVALKSKSEIDNLFAYDFTLERELLSAR